MKRRVAAVVPAAAGLAVLGAGWWLLPGSGEVATAAGRVAPVRRAVPPPPAPVAPTPPSLATLVAHADAPTLAAETARLQAAGVAVSTVQVAQDLKAAGRHAAALAYLDARDDGAAPATWRLRIDLLLATGRRRAAETALAEAVEAPRGIAPGEIVSAGYALDRADLLVRAAATHAIPAPDAALSLDLARRSAASGRPDLIAMLDRSGAADWRPGDPWLALRLATRAGDEAAALRAVALLPADQREEAGAQVLERAGDRAALRTMWRTRADRPGADRMAIAERLLAEGFRTDAVAVLRDASAGQAPEAPSSRRLLYLLGPRPDADDLAWLRRRAVADGGGWIAAYAERDRPAAALAFVAARPEAGRTGTALLRLRLARAARDEVAGRAAAAALLDGRTLDGETLAAIAATAPRLPDALSRALAERRAAAGVTTAAERLDLAWAAWNRGDAAGAAPLLHAYLRERPDDAAALTLMAEAEAKRGGTRAARPWLERALAATPDATRARADLLDRLGRRGEAIRLVEALRADAPADRALEALHARLLIAQGQPGRARAMLSR